MLSKQEILQNSLVIGVDVGGTNTDAVVLLERTVLSRAKCLTSSNVTSGVINAIQSALGDLKGRLAEPTAEGDIAANVCRVNIGTTHFINAIIQRKHLTKVSVVRLCETASTGLPPFSQFPDDLIAAIKGDAYLLKGGYEFNAAEISQIDRNELQRCFQDISAKGISNVVICGIFSPICNRQELQVAEILTECCPTASYTLSHQVAQLGLLERENVAILNETLKPLSEVTVQAFETALTKLSLNCHLYLTQNDGTLISAEGTRHFPILTFSSGPTNSMRGAMWLTDIKDALVVDIGGTSTDMGMLKNGFPREASTQREIGGVPTNFRMPDVPSIGLGGGSIVSVTEDSGKIAVTVGPESVANELFSKGKSFGGDVLTTTDVAMLAGIAPCLPKATPPEGIAPSLVYAVMQEIHKKLEDLIDRVKVDSGNIPVVLVGGGSILVDCSRPLHGSSALIRPLHFDVANAVGAALGQVSSTVDHIVTLDANDGGASRDKARTKAEELATKGVIEAGGDADTVNIVEVTEIPVPYVGATGIASRLKVKAVGDLKSTVTPKKTPSVTEPMPTEKVVKLLENESSGGNSPFWPFSSKEAKDNDKAANLPMPSVVDGVWTLNEHDVSCLAVGAGILGCGGGGNPEIGNRMAQQALRQGKQVRVVNPYCVSTDAFGCAVPVAFMGAPTIITEKLVNGKETLSALTALRQLLASGMYESGNEDGRKSCNGVTVENIPGFEGTYKAEGYQHKKYSNVPLNQRMTHLICAEIGGMNSIEPLLLGAEIGCPVLDVDGMGRAFPELQMYLPMIYGSLPYPTCLADHKGNVVAISHCDSPKSLEDVLRLETIRMGCSAGIALGCLQPKDVMSKCVLLSISRAWSLGRAILRAKNVGKAPHEAVVENQNGRVLITGKILDVSRTTEGGFSQGYVLVEGLDDFAGKHVTLVFQNEIIGAMKTTFNGGKPVRGDMLVTTPDLITLLDADTGYPVTTEEFQYGLRVVVVAMAADAKLKTEQALRVVGPRAFRLQTDYIQF